jgi:centrosomal protein CEP170
VCLLEPAIRDLPREGVNGSLSESTGKAAYAYRREPSYFEIPTRESQQRTAKTPEEGVVQEVPTKDTPDPALTPCDPSTPTPPVVQSHASFTIEFDDFTPGKIKIKDHVTKFTSRQRKQQALHLKAPVGAPVDLMSAESKVADWLVHSDVSMMKKRPTCEDVYSTKSDQAINTKTLKGQGSTSIH